MITLLITLHIFFTPIHQVGQPIYAPSTEQVERWCGMHDCVNYKLFDNRANV